MNIFLQVLAGIVGLEIIIRNCSSVVGAACSAYMLSAIVMGIFSSRRAA